MSLPGVSDPRPPDAPVVAADGSLGWTEGGADVWRFHPAADPRGPFIHPLRTPRGPVLTAAAPDAGPAGVSFIWRQINGAGFGGDAASTGRIHVHVPESEVLPDGGLVVRQRIDHLAPDGRRDLAEYRDLLFSAVARNGKFTIDWSGHFTAGPAGAVLADGSTGARSGLRIALDGGGEPVRFVTLPPPASAGGPFPGWAIRARAVGTRLRPSLRHPGSVAVLVDPRSTPGPPAWDLSEDVDAPAITAVLLPDGPRALEAGEVWEISFRLVVRPRQWDVEDLQLELFRWLQR